MFNTEKLKKTYQIFCNGLAISAIAAIAGLIAVIVISNRYSYALKNFGFAQGILGKHYLHSRTPGHRSERLSAMMMRMR